MKFSKLGKEQMIAGMSPESLLWATFSCSKLFISPILSGNGPTNSFELTSKTVTFFNNPISVGKQPFKPALAIISSFKVFAILDKLDGRQPLRLLLANTTTETGEFPIFSGRDDLNLLLLTNIASSFKSKRSFGISPSNSLYRMSRNLSKGRQRITVGNWPVNWLLLISSS